jgi:two-component system sensor histidine kinase KdpD
VDPKTNRFVAYASTVALVALATGVALLARPLFALPDLAMVYLLVIMVAAIRFGRGPSTLASALSVLACDFFFVPPYFTFAVSDQRFILTFAMMFAIGLVMSGLALRAREATLRARTEEMRNSLLDAVSHDLRSPLAAITGAATTLRDGQEVPPPERAELVATICEEAERLERLVRDLLDMTRLQSGALEVRREWVPLEEIVGSALERLEPRLQGRPVEVDLPGNLPLLSVDPVLLEQVLVNLLENAAKHTPAGSAIELRARDQAGGVTVEVSDRGPGLPAGAEARVFEKFFRQARPGVAGVGLGLSICRGIVEAHGGTILAENRAGGGATFRIALPMVGEAPPMPPDGDAADSPGEGR